MFIKYMAKNLKHNFVGYLLIVAVEALMLCVILCANGIITDTISEGNNVKFESSMFFLTFDHSRKAIDIADKIDELAERLPYDYKALNITGTRKQEENELYDGSFWIFQDYEDLRHFMKETFDVSDDQLPTRQEFENKEKVVMVGNHVIPDTKYPLAIDNIADGYIEVMGEKYRVSGYYGGVGMYLFWGTQSEELLEELLVTGFYIEMKDIMTDEQTDEVMSLYNELFGEIPLIRARLPATHALLERRANAANIMISVFMMIISSFNTLLIFKYILSKKKQGFAVFRFCGFRKSTCILYSGAEFMLLSAISAAVSCVAFDILIKPLMNEYYNVFRIIFDIGYYAVASAAYIGISLIMFLIYIAPSLSKSVTEELRNI